MVEDFVPQQIQSRHSATRKPCNRAVNADGARTFLSAATPERTYVPIPPCAVAVRTLLRTGMSALRPTGLGLGRLRHWPSCCTPRSSRNPIPRPAAGAFLLQAALLLQFA